MSKLFGRTLREAPADAEIPSHQLLIRAGLSKKLAAGIYSYLPLLNRTMQKVQRIIREEMDRIEGQEISMPVVQPAELWQESGRYQAIGSELVRFQDRSGRDMVLGMTHEEVVTDLVRRDVSSYRQLPFMLYQLQTKFRDEPRSRGGLIRVREFIMKDAYSFHTTQSDLDAYYEDVVAAYHRIFERCSLDVVQVQSDTGMMGGAEAHEFMQVTEVGEDTLLLCDTCGYAANQEVAGAAIEPLQVSQDVGEAKLVTTPNQKEIGEVAAFLNVDARQIIKALIYVSRGQIVLVAIRGDLKLNERKLMKALQDSEVRMATKEEAETAGLCPGFVSPVGLQKDIRIIVDQSVETGKGYVAGGNQVDYHMLNVVPGRDFADSERADLVLVEAGQNCPKCSGQLQEVRGVELGNTFKLGTKYSSTMGATYLDENGVKHPIVMGCYGIGVGRLVACILEAHHDDKGIIWPEAVAPYQVHLITLGKDAETVETSKRVYLEIQAAGLEVLWDERESTAGVKFNDADLIGLPYRVVVGARNLKQGLVEVKKRDSDEAELIRLDQLSRIWQAR